MRGSVVVVVGVLALGLGCAGCVLALPYPDAPAEVCDNGVDDDLDLRADCEDPDCNGVSPCTPAISWLTAGTPNVAPPAWTCPPNWRAVTVEAGASTCDPYPEAGELSCVAGWAFFPGDALCRPLGHTCPVGEWADDLPPTNVWYVRAGTASGDGTRVLPYATIAEAINAAAPTHGIVALAVGTYAETVIVGGGGVTIQGACVTATHITYTGPPGGLAVYALPGEGALVLADLEIDGSGSSIGVHSQRDLTLRGLVVTNTAGTGIVIYGNATTVSLDAEDVIVRHVAAGAGGIGGFGISAQSTDARLHRVRVEDVHTVGIAAGAGGSLAMSGVVVRDVHEEPATMTQGRGVTADVSTSLDQVLVERVRDIGLLLVRTATLTNLVVRDVAAGTFSYPVTGIGLASQADGQIDARGVLIERADLAGILVGASAHIVLADVVLRDDRPSAERARYGMLASDTTLEGERIWIEGAETAGAFARAGGILRLADLTIRGGGMGMVALEGGELDITRALVSDSVGAGIVGDGRGTALSLENVLVRDTMTAADGTAGYGLAVQNYALGEVDHFVARGSASMGVLVRGERATLTLSDAVLRDTRTAACASSCGGGIGLGSYENAHVIASRFLVAGAATCGLELASGSVFESHRGQVLDTPIGACVVGASIEPTPSDSFAYVGTGTASSNTGLPAPAALVLPVFE